MVASRWKRARKDSSREYSSERTLIATGTPRPGCMAVYTTPMAPRPISVWI